MITGALGQDVKIVLKLFKDNKFFTNPVKFEFMILSKITVNHSIVILRRRIAPSKSVKLFKLNLDEKTKF